MLGMLNDDGAMEVGAEVVAGFIAGGAIAGAPAGGLKAEGCDTPHIIGGITCPPIPITLLAPELGTLVGPVAAPAYDDDAIGVTGMLGILNDGWTIEVGAEVLGGLMANGAAVAGAPASGLNAEGFATFGAKGLYIGALESPLGFAAGGGN